MLPKPSRSACFGPPIALVAFCALACTVPPTASPSTAPATGVPAAVPRGTAAPAIARKPLAAVLADVRHEVAALDSVLETATATARALGALNGKLQSRGYFRRVPMGTAVDTLDSHLRALATDRMLTVAAFEARDLDPPRPPPPRPRLIPGVSWEPELADLRRTLTLHLALLGRPQDVAQFVNLLPTRVERLVVITGSEAIPGGVRLVGEAYFEHDLPPPEVDFAWPPLDVRLRAAGIDPKDPALPKDLDWTALQYADAEGRAKTPDARGIMQIAADFPRWLLRAKHFEDRAAAAVAVRGELLLGTVAPR